RRYEIKNDNTFLKEGDVLAAAFRLEPMLYGRNGYIGRLEMSNAVVQEDAVTKLKNLKKAMTEDVIDAYGYDAGGLMASLVLGHKDDVDNRRISDMRSMGIMHILSISGFH